MAEASSRKARAELERGLTGLVAQGIVPGGAAAVVADGTLVFEHAFGCRTLLPQPEPATADTLWDCASLTKPLVTAACLLVLRERGTVDFDAPASELVPEMGHGPPRPPTLGELLVHAGGLPAWEPLYAHVAGGLEERAAWLGRHRDEPGREVVYGCPGYQVLGLAAERATSTPLRQLARELVLGEDDDLPFPPAPEDAPRCAATELGNRREREMAGERAAAYRGFRDGLIRGEVHDHCAFTAGGAAGNAGLFGTAAAVARLAARFLVPGDLLPASALAELSRDRARVGSVPRTWGFQLAADPGSPAGGRLSPDSFGHAGFTGTSVFVDPRRRAAFVLLTNRIHPRYTERAFHADRRRFHDAAAGLVDALAREGAP